MCSGEFPNSVEAHRLKAFCLYRLPTPRRTECAVFRTDDTHIIAAPIVHDLHAGHPEAITQRVTEHPMLEVGVFVQVEKVRRARDRIAVLQRSRAGVAGVSSVLIPGGSRRGSDAKRF